MVGQQPERVGRIRKATPWVRYPMDALLAHSMAPCTVERWGGFCLCVVVSRVLVPMRVGLNNSDLFVESPLVSYFLRIFLCSAPGRLAQLKSLICFTMKDYHKKNQS